MVDKLIKILITILGMALGVGIVALANSFKSLDMLPISQGRHIIIYIGLSLILGIISFILSNKIIDLAKKTINETEKRLQNIPALDIVLGAIGLIVGFFIAYLLSLLLTKIPYVGVVLSALVYIVLGYLGVKVTTRQTDDFKNVVNVFKKSTVKDKNIQTGAVKPKILDTSVIIDGRIYDIVRTGFLEGTLLIPQFVLHELQHIADSSDSLKRVRGRRGLDILNIIQKELNIEVEISNRDFDDIAEVDAKLLKLAQTLGGKVVTNDYNLNKVAQVQGVEVLNINELANAINPVAIPGEHMIVQVVKEGKEANQGIAYLDDGTMIVVDGGKRYMGQTISVLVTSVLQTPAGRMIFGKPKVD